MFSKKTDQLFGMGDGGYGSQETVLFSLWTCSILSLMLSPLLVFDDLMSIMQY